MDLVEQVEICRIATACGIYSNTGLSEFLDKIIVDLYEPPYEIIEASLACNKNMQDALHILKEYFYSNNGSKTNINKHLLCIIRERYHSHKITLEDAIYYLDNLLKETDLENEIIANINYLSDGLYLAKERIYGEVEDIEQDFIKFISQYQ